MIRIIVDSASDITQEQAKAYGIDVLPLKTRIGEKEYLDGINISHIEFFELLVETDMFPQTSCISPAEYAEYFEKYKDDEILVITLSSKLSGCYQSAMIAKEDYDNVYVVDSENVAIGMRIVIEIALNEVAAGKSIKEIVEILETKKKEVCLIALIDTLEYLKRGGRISNTAAAVGTFLSIKPVISIIEGEVVILGKARGSKSGCNMLDNYIEKYEIDFDLPYSVAYSGMSDALLKKYVKDNEYITEEQKKSIPVHTIGSTIGTHVGPNAIAAAFIKKHN